MRHVKTHFKCFRYYTAGILRDDDSRVDVDREYVLFMGAVNESNSWLIDENVNRCGHPEECKSLVKCGNKDFIDSTIYQQVISIHLYFHFCFMLFCWDFE